MKTNTRVTTQPKLITSPNEESPHISVTQLPKITTIVTATVIFAAVGNDSQSMSRRIRTDSPRGAGDSANQTSPCASGPKQLRFHSAKVEINNVFQKHSSGWEMQNDICIFMADGLPQGSFESSDFCTEVWTVFKFLGEEVIILDGLTNL
ncbi:hypothetical protein CEXT_300331 [Caerostris extrusa]|uniref:Uncharacterized protein n=1 Tax=Caerostris extrusa TaxID=172846 RepID=A0AAV4V5F8_CAEEX|nr:hypothetical protein CEXT_300331 [Caerostris extrusa]